MVARPDAVIDEMLAHHLDVFGKAFDADQLDVADAAPARRRIGRNEPRAPARAELDGDNPAARRRDRIEQSQPFLAGVKEALIGMGEPEDMPLRPLRQRHIAHAGPHAEEVVIEARLAEDQVFSHGPFASTESERAGSRD